MSTFGLFEGLSAGRCQTAFWIFGGFFHDVDFFLAEVFLPTAVFFFDGAFFAEATFFEDDFFFVGDFFAESPARCSLAAFMLSTKLG